MEELIEELKEVVKKIDNEFNKKVHPVREEIKCFQKRIENLAFKCKLDKNRI